MQGSPDKPAEAAARPSIAVIGGGPAGLMAAEVAARGGADVIVYDRMPSPGRKLLLAGRGGLNLTHSEPLPRFLSRYGTAQDRLAPLLATFGPTELRHWCTELGIETFVGTSGRVFPTAFKTSPFLRAWLRRLDRSGVDFRLNHHWLGWDANGRLRFTVADGEAVVAADATILALGGASWPQLGSDGAWATMLRENGVETAPLQSANCGFVVGWSDGFREKFEGQPLKSITLSFEGERVRGDAMVTRDGLEGAPVYALAPRLRAAVADSGQAILQVALRPHVAVEALEDRLRRRRRKDSVSTMLRRTLGLPPVAIGLMREACLSGRTSLSTLDATALAHLVNALPIRLLEPMAIGRAISTAGGIRFAAVDDRLMLRGRAGTFVAGEMLDWEAPTGGYLLQGCFATGVAAGEGALAWLAGRGLEANISVRVTATGDVRRDNHDVSALP